MFGCRVMSWAITQVILGKFLPQLKFSKNEKITNRPTVYKKLYVWLQSYGPGQANRLFWAKFCPLTLNIKIFQH